VTSTTILKRMIKDLDEDIQDAFRRIADIEERLDAN